MKNRIRKPLRACLLVAVCLAIGFQGTATAAVPDLWTFYVPGDENLCEAGTAEELTGTGNLEQTWNFFAGKGLSAPQIAGIIGNLQHESGISPTRIQGRPIDQGSNSPADAGSGGWGIMQWTPGSKIFGLMRDAGITTPVYNLASQLQLVWWHLNNVSPTGERNVFPGFQAINDVEDAVAYFEEHMEGAGIPALESRNRLARAALETYGSNTGAGSTPAGSTGGGSGCGSSVADAGTCPTQDDPYIDNQAAMANVQGVFVHPCISGRMDQLFNAARAAGLDIVTGSSGWRSHQRQVELYIDHCGSLSAPRSACSPPTATPGNSMHERGVAIDFRCNGGSFTSYGPCWGWMTAHAAQYGLINLPSENWHWSTTGN
jgi:hypothetical protein